MIGTFNIMLIYQDGEWNTMPPMAGTPFDKMGQGEGTAGAVILIQDAVNAREVVEKLAAKLMDAGNGDET